MKLDETLREDGFDFAKTGAGAAELLDEVLKASKRHCERNPEEIARVRRETDGMTKSEMIDAIIKDLQWLEKFISEKSGKNRQECR